MPTLTPVDNDPFAPPPGAGSPKLTPVDHDPFASSPAPPAGQDLGTTAFWNKPANVTPWDYMLAHLAKPFQGADQAAQDYSRTAVDAATFGQGDRLQAYLTGNPLDKERAATAAASGRLGAMAPIVQGAMYAMGPGELGIAKGLGEAAAPVLGGGKVAQWAGGVLGSGVEGAGAGMVGAAGHDENPNQGMLWGGGLGALGGVPGGIVGRGGTLAPAVSEDALRARATQEYAPLEEAVFHGPSQVKPALDTIKSTMTEDEQLRASGTMTKVNKLIGSGLLTGKDIQANQKALGALSKGAVDTDREYAPQFNKALQNVLETTTPYGRNITPGKGMSLMTPGTLGAPPMAAGEAAAAKAAGDVFHGRANDIARMDDPETGWIARSQIPRGPDVGDQARAYMLSTGTFAKPGKPGYDELKTLAGTGAGQDVTAAPGAWDVRHAMHPLVSGLLTGAATGAGGQIAEGHFDPMHLLAEAGTGAVLGYGLHKGVPAFQAKFFQQPAQQRAIDAYRVAASTGQPQAAVLPTTPLRDMIRNLIYSQGARGAY